MLAAANPAAPAPYSDASNGAVTPMNQPLSGNVLSNANLPTGTTTQVTGISVAGTSLIYPVGSTVTLSDPLTGQPMGTLVVQRSGAYTFTPVAGYIGPAPAVSVYSQASNGQTAVSALTIDVVPGGPLAMAASLPGV